MVHLIQFIRSEFFSHMMSAFLSKESIAEIGDNANLVSIPVRHFYLPGTSLDALFQSLEMQGV